MLCARLVRRPCLGASASASAPPVRSLGPPSHAAFSRRGSGGRGGRGTDAAEKQRDGDGGGGGAGSGGASRSTSRGQTAGSGGGGSVELGGNGGGLGGGSYGGTARWLAVCWLRWPPALPFFPRRRRARGKKTDRCLLWPLPPFPRRRAGGTTTRSLLRRPLPPFPWRRAGGVATRSLLRGQPRQWMCVSHPPLFLCRCLCVCLFLRWRRRPGPLADARRGGRRAPRGALLRTLPAPRELRHREAHCVPYLGEGLRHCCYAASARNGMAGRAAAETGRGLLVAATCRHAVARGAAPAGRVVARCASRH